MVIDNNTQPAVATPLFDAATKTALEGIDGRRRQRDRLVGQRTLSVSMIGTRGVPAAYGGFETAVEEVGRRLIERGHDVTVYTRGADTSIRSYLGMNIVHLPAVRQKQLETLSHTAFSVAHAVTHRRPDAAFVFNAANSPFLPLLRARGIPTALHMDGLEWKRAKWGARGQRYYRWAEQHGVRSADALIADAPGIAAYYADQFGVPTELIRYGAPLQDAAESERLGQYGVKPGSYHLVVARFEPENHVLEIVEGFARSTSTKQLLVVGSAPYSGEYTAKIRQIAESDARITLAGGVYDQDTLDQLYFHAYTYAHGHSVGGTNPSLLRAIGAGTPVIAYSVGFNREVLDNRGWFFSSAAEVAHAFEVAESDPRRAAKIGTSLRARAAEQFSWDDVAGAYEELAYRLARGHSVHRTARLAHRADRVFQS